MSSAPAHATLLMPELGCRSASALTIGRERSGLPGVARVYVNLLAEMAYVEHDAARCSLAALDAALRRSGYEVGVP